MTWRAVRPDNPRLARLPICERLHDVFDRARSRFPVWRRPDVQRGALPPAGFHAPSCRPAVTEVLGPPARPADSLIALLEAVEAAIVGRAAPGPVGVGAAPAPTTSNSSARPPISLFMNCVFVVSQPDSSLVLIGAISSPTMGRHGACWTQRRGEVTRLVASASPKRTPPRSSRPNA
jgi:hypothetical protein